MGKEPQECGFIGYMDRVTYRLSYFLPLLDLDRKDLIFDNRYTGRLESILLRLGAKAVEEEGENHGSC